MVLQPSLNKTAINAADVTCMNHNKEYAKTKLTMPVLALGGTHSFGISICNLWLTMSVAVWQLKSLDSRRTARVFNKNA
jgi:hypothetical protein